MRRFNLYYVISTISLAFMMFILLRTLQVGGWFEDHRGKSPSELFQGDLVGSYLLHRSDAPDQEIQIIRRDSLDEVDWLVLVRDSIPVFSARFSNFEEDQILAEIFEFDSTGQELRLEGCELLISGVSSEQSGKTIGEFCGLKGNSEVYIDLKLQFQKTDILLQVEKRQFDNSVLVSRIDVLLERQ